MRIALGYIAGAFFWATCAGAGAADFDPRDYRAQIHPISPHVWLFKQPIGHEWHGNATLIEQSDGLILIDTGGSAGDGRHIASLVQSISDKPVKAVILTHWHDDHTLGLSAIKDAWPNVRIVAAEGALDGMEKMMTKRTGLGAPDPALEAARAERFAGYIQNYLAEAENASHTDDQRSAAEEAATVLRLRRKGYEGSYIVRPTELVADRLVIDDPETPIEISFLGRGNSQGDLVIRLPMQGVVVVGDLVVQPVPYGFSVFPEDWATTLRKLDAMDFTLLIPGHGEPVQDRLYLRLALWSIEDIRKQVAALAIDGATLDEVKARMDYSVHRAKWAPHDPTLWLDGITASVYNEAIGVPNLGGL